jgi:hypothetical protein
MPRKATKKNSRKASKKNSKAKISDKTTKKKSHRIPTNLKGRGTKKNVEPQSKHWRDQTPMTKKKRQEMPSHCLLDPVGLRYPICKTNSSQISCIGLHAAEKRARLQRDSFILQKAKMLQESYC